jgi:hypothetical protein
MASITDHFGITGDVPFVDVDLTTDTKQYVDPHRIRLRGIPTKTSAEALKCLDTFLGAITHAVLIADPAGTSLLADFTEPRETRLGMAAQGSNGHGSSAEIGEQIWKALNTDLHALLDVGILKHLEDLPVFVHGIDKDITSDITTRIIYSPLVDFTTEMIQRYPVIGAQMQSFDKRIWDPGSNTWMTRTVSLPVVDDKALLLVPRQWVGTALLLNAKRFYETEMLTYAQAEQTTVLANGKINRPNKDQLKKQPALPRGRDTHLKVTLRAHAAGDDLMGLFRFFAKQQFLRKLR